MSQMIGAHRDDAGEKFLSIRESFQCAKCKAHATIGDGLSHFSLSSG